MQIPRGKIQEKRFLVLSLLLIGAAITFANLINEDTATMVGNYMYGPVVGVFVVLSVIIAIQNKLKGSHGKAWGLFAIGAILWFSAEMMWIVYEEIFEVVPWPSDADIFWFIGYPFYFGFLILYLKPFSKSISKKMILASSLVGFTLLIPSLIVSFDNELGINNIEHILGLGYPVSDSITLIPAVIGIFLFFRGKVNFLWTLMCFGMLCNIVADSAFLFLTINNIYYTGHPIDILYLWSYTVFSFGVYNHIKLFNTKKEHHKSVNKI